MRLTLPAQRPSFFVVRRLLQVAAALLLPILISRLFVESFVLAPLQNTQQTAAFQYDLRLLTSQRRDFRSCLHMTAFEPDLTASPTDNPWRLLGVPRGADPKEIKRAYKRLAVQYHPDVVTTRDSSPSEKRAASDAFAKINAAYAAATAGAGSQRGATTTTGATGTGGWEPPHRRAGSYSSSSAGTTTTGSSGTPSTDWRDYMPNYDSEDAKYDAGGDSFEKIMSDLFQGAAASAVGASSGGGGIFRDFVEFLENNVGGYGGTQEDDAELRVLLQTGSVDEIGEEMDETELVVQQLSSKLRNTQDELRQVTADRAVASKYMEKLELQERLDELEARKGVVEGYIQRAKKRLLSLQTRYKELIVRGQNDRRAGGRSSSSPSWEDIKRESDSSYGTAYTGSATSERPGRSTSSSDKEDAWKDEGFGSFGRGRGSSRRRSSRQTADVSGSSSSSSSSSSNSADYSSSSTRSSGSASPRSRTNSSTASSESSQQYRPMTERPRQESYVPPHRRQSSYSPEEDQRRLREIKVDEEFDKLKKELGL